MKTRRTRKRSAAEANAGDGLSDSAPVRKLRKRATALVENDLDSDCWMEVFANFSLKLCLQLEITSKSWQSRIYHAHTHLDTAKLRIPRGREFRGRFEVALKRLDRRVRSVRVSLLTNGGDYDYDDEPLDVDEELVAAIAARAPRLEALEFDAARLTVDAFERIEHFVNLTSFCFWGSSLSVRILRPSKGRRVRSDPFEPMLDSLIANLGRLRRLDVWNSTTPLSSLSFLGNLPTGMRRVCFAAGAKLTSDDHASLREMLRRQGDLVDFRLHRRPIGAPVNGTDFLAEDKRPGRSIIRALAACCPKLKQLALQYNDAVSLDDILELRNLQCLRLNTSLATTGGELSDDDAIEVCARNPNLDCFDCSGCTDRRQPHERLFLEGFASLAKLTRLDISCDLGSALTDTHLRAICDASGATLKQIYVWDAPRLTVESLKVVASVCCRLDELELGFTTRGSTMSICAPAAIRAFIDTLLASDSWASYREVNIRVRMPVHAGTDEFCSGLSCLFGLPSTIHVKYDNIDGKTPVWFDSAKQLKLRN